jgi:hypothetical protein
MDTSFSKEELLHYKRTVESQILSVDVELNFLKIQELNDEPVSRQYIELLKGLKTELKRASNSWSELMEMAAKMENDAS